jgi:hypothetical protein
MHPVIVEQLVRQHQQDLWNHTRQSRLAREAREAREAGGEVDQHGPTRHLAVAAAIVMLMAIAVFTLI